MSHLQQCLCSSNIWRTSGLIPLPSTASCFASHGRVPWHVSTAVQGEKQQQSDEICCLIMTSLLPDRLYFQIDRSVLTGADLGEASRGYLQTGSRSCGTSPWLYLLPVSASWCGKGSPCGLSLLEVRVLCHMTYVYYSAVSGRLCSKINNYIKLAATSKTFKVRVFWLLDFRSGHVLDLESGFLEQSLVSDTPTYPPPYSCIFLPFTPLERWLQEECVNLSMRFWGHWGVCR